MTSDGEARPAAAWALASRTAPAPSGNSRRPVLQPDERDHERRSASGNAPAFGVYIHWPFCLSKCPYCDFNSHVRHAAIDEARFVRAFLAEIAANAARAPGRTVTSIFFGGGTPSLMQPATVGAHPGRDRARLERGARRRGHARGQSDQRRGDAVSRLPGSRRQPGVARRAGARRWRAQAAGPHPYRRGSARRGRDRAAGVRALFVRSDLCARAADPAGLGGRAQARHRGSGRASLALSAHHRAGHAVCGAARRRQAHGSGRGQRAPALRPDAGDLRARRAAGLRGLQSCARRARSAGTIWSIGACRNMPASAPAPMGGSTSTAPPRHRDREAAGNLADAGGVARPRRR